MSSPRDYVTPVAKQIPFDNSTDGFNSTNVQAAIEEATHRLLFSETSSTSSASTSSSTNALMTGMSVSLGPGTFLLLFNTDVNVTTAGAAVTSLFNVGGTDLGVSQQKIVPFDGGTLSVGAARGIMHLQATVTLATAQTVEVHWSVSSGTATAANRTLITLQISP